MHFNHTDHVWISLKFYCYDLKGKKMTTSKTSSTPKKAPSKKATAAKTSVPKGTTKTVTPKKIATKKTAVVKKASPRKVSVKTTKPSPEALYKMTEVAAYYIALNHGFSGNPSDYWIAAEAQITALYK